MPGEDPMDTDTSTTISGAVLSTTEPREHVDVTVPGAAVARGGAR